MDCAVMVNLIVAAVIAKSNVVVRDIISNPPVIEVQLVKLTHLF